MPRPLTLIPALLLLLLLGAVAVPRAAAAFTIDARSENPALDEAALRAATVKVAAEVGNRIPDSADVKVSVYSRAVPSKRHPGEVLFLHKIELRKALQGGPPYPYHGWLPLRTVERYGVDTDPAVRAQLDLALREFFTALRDVDPAQGID